MKTCKTFEELQEVGAESIHERTHISRDKVELVLTKSYGEINKIQFMGFMSILEREYGLDLSDIKEEYLRYQEEHQSTLPPKQSVILQPSSSSKQKWVVAGLTSIIILVIVGYFAQAKMANVPSEEVMKLSSAAVEVFEAAEEANTTQPQAADVNTTLPVAEGNTTGVKPPVANAAAAEGIEIRPISKVWVGMIDLATHEKTQMITKDPIKIDTTKNWLIVLGHGRVEIVSAAGNEVMNEVNTVWLSCENGVIKRLTNQEFLAQNGGKGW